MIDCPNCNKKMNEHFEYCRICGSKLNGEKSGDYSTEIINLFKDDDGYYYLFAVNGKQVILRNKDKEELEKEVLNRNYPWIEKKNLKEKKNIIESKQEIQKELKDEIQYETQNEFNDEIQDEFEDGFVYVTKEEDVNFGKIRYYDPETGQGMETWGPDNSERAKNLRKKILGKYV